MKIIRISKESALRVIVKYHYAKTLPRINKLFLGSVIDGKMEAVMTLGWGVRPLHTIKKLFPSLVTQDYWEIGKLCLADHLPRNSESKFISDCLRYIKKNYPRIKLVYSWADGMLAKPGYVYQASNFLYGGFIWTDAYFSKKGEKIHPRTTNKIGGRPSKKKQEELGFKHYFGKQFRYIYFICSKKEQKRLLKESPYDWTKAYPKHADLEWKKSVDGKRILCEKPFYDENYQEFSDNAVRNVKWVKQNPSITDLLRGKVQERTANFPS